MSQHAVATPSQSAEESTTLGMGEAKVWGLYKTGFCFQSPTEVDVRSLQSSEFRDNAFTHALKPRFWTNTLH